MLTVCSAQASIVILMELHKHCPDVFERMEIYLDGGFERGTDILKAIALGATAVGIGRPFLYSLAYGQEGAEHLIQSKLFQAFVSSERLANSTQSLKTSLRRR